MIDERQGGNRWRVVLGMLAMRELRTRVDIEAPVERVWKILTAFERFPEWNPLLTRMSGKLERGAPLRFMVALGGRSVPVDATVLVVEPSAELRWRGPRSELLGRVFAGEHFFLLEKRDGKTRLVHGEDFSGIAVPLAWPLLEPRLVKGYTRMNEALKARAEAADD